MPDNDIDPSTLPPVPSLWPPKDAPTPKFSLVLETIRFEGAIQQVFLEAITNYLAVAKSRGWERLALASDVTGNPKNLIQIWKTPYPYPGTIDLSGQVPPDQQLQVLRGYQKFFEGAAVFERTVLAPLPYDPDGDRGTLTKNDTLLLVRANVRDGAMARLVQLKQTFFKPLVENEFHWKLRSAGYVVSDSQPGSTIVQCWKLPDANALGKTMASMGQNGNYRVYVAPCITQENQEFYSCISGAS